MLEGKWVDLAHYDFVVVVWDLLALAKGVVLLHDYHDQLRHCLGGCNDSIMMGKYKNGGDHWR